MNRPVFVAGPTSWNTIFHLDRLPEPRPHTVFARREHETLGGTSAGKALHLVDLGEEVVLHTVVGRDPTAEVIRSALTGAGAPVSAWVGEGHSERHLNLMTAAGERLSIYLSVPRLPMATEPDALTALAGSRVAVLDLSELGGRLLGPARDVAWRSGRTCTTTTGASSSTQPFVRRSADLDQAGSGTAGRSHRHKRGTRMAEQDLHVVVGAGGASGRQVVHHLREAGHRVRAVTRDGRDVGTPGVELVASDVTEQTSLARACQGARVVYHCVMPPIGRWLPEFPVLTDALLAAAATAGARLVFADDTWMYGRVTAPMTEDTPYRPVTAKGVLRAWLAERILHAGASGQLPVSIVRAGELYGPGVRSVIAGNFFGAALAGRAVHWLGDPDLPLTPTFIGDFGRALATIGGQDTSRAAVWHVPHPPPTTGRLLAAEACRQAKTRLRLFRHGARPLRAIGHVWPLAQEGAELVYQFEQPFVVNGSRAAATFDLDVTPIRLGVQATLDSLTARKPPGFIGDSVGWLWSR